jgi:hypothetical protein
LPGSAQDELVSRAGEASIERALLAGTEIAPGASKPVARLTMAIAALPGIVPLVDFERGLTQLPYVQLSTVRSLRKGRATVDLMLRPATAPLIVAAEILGLQACPLAFDSVGEQRIVARYNPDKLTAASP